MKNPNNWRNFAIILFLLLLGAGVFIYMQVQSAKVEKYKRMSDHLQFQRVTEELKTRMANRDTTIAHIQAIRRSDSVKYVSEKNASQALILAKNEQIARLRSIVQPQIDANPDLSEFVTAQDVKIGLLEKEINTSELYCIGQINDLNTVINQQRHKTEEALQIAEDQKQRGDNLEKDVKKAGKAKRFWRGVAGVVGAVLIVELITK